MGSLTSADITLRRAKGSILLRDEVDDNFENFKDYANALSVLTDAAQAKADQAYTQATQNQTALAAIQLLLGTFNPGDVQAPEVSITYTGSKTYRSISEPSAPQGGFQLNDEWIKTGEPFSTRSRYWNGSSWQVDTLYVDPADLAAGQIGILVVTGLPTAGAPPRLAYNTQDGILYKDLGASWEPIVQDGEITFSIADGSITAAKLAANSVTAGKIAAGIVNSTHLTAGSPVITNKLQMGDGTVPSAAIESLAADKIAVGNLAAVNLARAGNLYEPANPAKYFKAVSISTGLSTSHNFGSGSAWTFTHMTDPAILYGTTVSSDPGKTFSHDDGVLKLSFKATLRDYNGDICCYYEKNSSGVYVPIGAETNDQGADAITFGTRLLTGISSSDTLRFYVAPINGATGTPSSTGLTLRSEVELVSFNW